ncbi:TetR family transcriptional regulator [Micromonospora kangleipakensis]|uniref:TetR family transcriptional regulator n=2 Tax=Micromonospora kangleipakensis TaxID=1077942 RepID=A0A4Q8BGD4_9ACTN|nr:TetR family transcriptional regulator [Micromonospora kangleipakensis]
MGRMSAEARREQLVEAAIEVMSREGLERATTRRIAQQAGTAQGAMHYAFRDKNELLTAVVGAVTVQVEQVLRDAVDPARGLAAAIDDGLRAFWRFVVGDDGLQLMQYELAIFCCRTPGYEWLAAWQYTRYAAAVQEVFQAAIDHEPGPQEVDLPGLCRFVVAAVDGLILQYEVHHDIDQSERDLSNVIRCAVILAGLTPPG